MICKNCGEKLKDDARVCPNCGAFVDDETGYTLLTADDRLDDLYSSDEPAPVKKKNRAPWAYIISLILAVTVAAGGAYYYFTHINPPQKGAPTVEMETGCGIINDTQPVIYVTLEKNANLQYIQGVSLYSIKGEEEPVLISTEYEYTKNIDDTFRAVFFDTSEFGLKSGKTYRFIFELKLSYLNDSNIYTYKKEAEIKGGFKDNAGDTVFDHSNSAEIGDEEEKTEKPETTKADTTKKKSDTSFIYNGYWFTEPKTEKDTRTIQAFRFNKDNTFVSTNYKKEGSKAWSVSTVKGTFEIKDDVITVKTDKGKTKYRAEKGGLAEVSDGKTVQKLTARKYNSVKNVEDFFGM